MNNTHNDSAFPSDPLEIIMTEPTGSDHNSDHSPLAMALAETSSLLTSTLDLEVVVDRILMYVGRIVPNDFTNIMLIKNSSAHVKYWSGYPEAYNTFFTTVAFPLETPNLMAMLTSGQPFIIANTDAYAGWIRAPWQGQVCSYLGAPIRVRDQIIGFLNLESTQTHFFSKTHAAYLQMFANQAALAIENAELFTRANEYAAMLEGRVAERTAELSAANKRLQSLDWLKTKFIADASHELRTPVASLTLLTYLLEHDNTENWSTHVDALKTRVGELNCLIENILDFAQLETEFRGHERRFAPLAIQPLLQNVLDSCTLSARDKGLELTATLNPVSRMIYGDENQLVRVFTNLLSNAIRYTPKGSVHLHMAEHAGHVYIAIQDTGIGIDPEDIPFLFDRFYRGKHVGSRNLPGTGLGLSIVKEIVGLHQGTIDVTSEPDCGSTFTVCLALNDA